MNERKDVVAFYGGDLRLVSGESMKLDEIPLPVAHHRHAVMTTASGTGWVPSYSEDQMRAAMRAGALAALDEVLAYMGNDRVDAYTIHRLRDTIMEGK